MKKTAALLFALSLVLVAQSPQLRSNDGQNKRLGSLNKNKHDPDSVANPYGRYGSRYSPDSVNNPYGQYGSKYSPYSANNPYATKAPKVVTPNGDYLGTYSRNPYDPDSVSNRSGRHGNPYSPDSINNRYGRYGSEYSPAGVRNRHAVGSPDSSGKSETKPTSRRGFFGGWYKPEANANKGSRR